MEFNLLTALEPLKTRVFIKDFSIYKYMENITVEESTQTESIKKRMGKPRKLDPNSEMTWIEYRRLYQREYYRERPRYIRKTPKRTPEESREREKEMQRLYYEKNKEKMIAQIKEAEKKRRETKRRQRIIDRVEKLQLLLKETQST